MNETKSCQNCKQNFVIEPRDFDFYAKIRVPAPTWCPTCRAMRRMMFANYSQLFRKVEKRTGQELFSSYPEESPIEIYHRDYWWSDAWDSISYGQDYDFSRPFFDQLRDLMRSVPHPSQNVRGMVNSDYSNEASYLKNCYLCMNAGYCEDCLYSNQVHRCHNCVDTFGSVETDLCYEVFETVKCYQCFYSANLSDCLNVWFSNACAGCQNCFGCTGLRKKQFCLFNKQLSERDYKEELGKLSSGAFSQLSLIKNRAREVYLSVPHKFSQQIHCINSTGDFLLNSKNARSCYEAGYLEDSAYCDNIMEGAKDSYDLSCWGEHSELVYEAIGCGDQCAGIKFCLNSWPAMRESEYAIDCHSSANLFGCVGLKKSQYCIFNKQYTKEAFGELRLKIIRHMDEMPYIDSRGRVYKYGEFFPPDMSLYAYNESLASDVYPKTREEVLDHDWTWREPNPKAYQVTLSASELPDHIKDTPDSITKELIACLDCKKAYRILPQELEFYRRFSLPLPRYCHRCRYATRLLQRNPRHLYDRTCAKCSAPIKTTYAPDRHEIVYCESCYQIEVT